MRLLEHREMTIPPSLPTEPARIVALSDHRKPTKRPYDDLRELTVVVLARTKLIEHRLANQHLDDPHLAAGLADIDAAVTAIGARLDALEDALSRCAA